MNNVNIEKLEQFSAKLVGDISSSFCSLLTYMADDSGVFQAMGDGKRYNSKSLAEKAQVDPRYLEEMLSALAANEYVSYDAMRHEFFLNPEQMAVFASEDQPTNMLGIFQVITAQFAKHQIAINIFKSGEGRPWGDHHSCQFCGTDRFFKPGYLSNLLSNWIPALDGVEEKLRAGGSIADIGCGHGSSSVLMAQEFPKSKVIGYDFHALSIEDARSKAQKADLNNIEFHCADAKQIAPADGYDLVCIFDALHDMGDPVGAARHLGNCLNPNGTLMIVEPLAGDTTADNMHPIGGLFYAASTLVCLPCSRAQDVALCLGAQAGPQKLTDVLNQAGFNYVRVATQTATNLVIEARIL